MRCYASAFLSLVLTLFVGGLGRGSPFFRCSASCRMPLLVACCLGMASGLSYGSGLLHARILQGECVLFFAYSGPLMAAFYLESMVFLVWSPCAMCPSLRWGWALWPPPFTAWWRFSVLRAECKLRGAVAGLGVSVFRCFLGEAPSLHGPLPELYCTISAPGFCLSLCRACVIWAFHPILLKPLPVRRFRVPA